MMRSQRFDDSQPPRPRIDQANMSIEDDVALLERVPTLNALGQVALRVLAIGCEQRDYPTGATMFRKGDPADAGFVVQRGAFRVSTDDGTGREMIARTGSLIGELALIVTAPRGATAVAVESSSVIRISRSLFQRVLDSDPMAARRLRDAFADRAAKMAEQISVISGNMMS